MAAEVERFRPENNPPAMKYDDVSMEQSMGFVNALQELKNLRPQLYSAADYCEKSYLHSEQKQMVLDNLKDYAVRALVNAVDHLGTVAYKLTDLIDQQTLEISAMELNVSCVNQVWQMQMQLSQKLLTCQTYTDREALRQQQLLATIPRHHKHYLLPNSVNKKVHFSPQIQTDARQSHIQTRPRLFPSGTPASKTLSWHLASETKSTLKGNPRVLTSSEDPKDSGKFHLSDDGHGSRAKSPAVRRQLPSVGPASSTALQTLGVAQRDFLENTKPMTPFRSFDNPKRELVQAPVRSKSVLSAFFVKQKTPKMRTSAVS